MGGDFLTHTPPQASTGVLVPKAENRVLGWKPQDELSHQGAWLGQSNP